MKKLLLLLLISALAIFVFAGCDGITPDPDPDPDPDPPIEGITVEVEDEVVLAGKTWVKGGVNREVTVTFPAPVVNALVYVSGCDSRGPLPEGADRDKLSIFYADPIAMWPNEDRTVWTGTYRFGGYDCCSAMIMVEAGECEPDVCVYYPVVVDHYPPYAEVWVSTDNCPDPCDPDKCVIEFGTAEDPCFPPCCGDDCSGVASWTITIFDDKDVLIQECCDLFLCADPIVVITDDDCPIEGTTPCLLPGTYWVNISMADNVGNTSEADYKILVNADCSYVLYECYCDITTDWTWVCDTASYIILGGGCM